MPHDIDITYGNSEATFQEIGDRVGLSRQGARHVYDRAIQKLQADPKLRAYWEDMCNKEANDFRWEKLD